MVDGDLRIKYKDVDAIGFLGTQIYTRLSGNNNNQTPIK